MSVRAVLKADHPERDHEARVVERAHPGLDQAVMHREERAVLLAGADDHVGVELELAVAASDRPGEDARLDRRHANVAVELRAPRGRVGLDEEPEDAVADLVASGRPVGRAPLREVVREPARLVKRGCLEVVLELDGERIAIQGLGGDGHGRSVRWSTARRAW